MREPDLPEILDLFPALIGTAWEKTSEPDEQYNCLAWAFGAQDAWWQAERVRGYYWPPGVSRENTIENWTNIAATHGFELCADAMLEAGWEKVAIYVDSDGEPAHIVRSSKNGGWFSKLGKLEDIWHESLVSLECKDYGKPTVFLKKRRPDWA